MVLGVRKRNAGGPFGTHCPPGPYNFQAGRVEQQCDLFHFYSLHNGGVHFLFADGAVRFMTYEADTILPALATRAGREIIELPLN